MRIILCGAPFELVLARTSDPPAIGESSDTNRTITIDPSYPLEVRNETLCHEIVHMMLAMTGLCHNLTEQQEEAVAQGIGLALAHLVKHNPDLIAILTKEKT